MNYLLDSLVYNIMQWEFVPNLEVKLKFTVKNSIIIRRIFTVIASLKVGAYYTRELISLPICQK